MEKKGLIILIASGALLTALVTILAVTLSPTGDNVTTASAAQPTVPTECNSVNQGRCECGDTSKGFTTYTFWLNGVQRCFTFFRPISNAPLPVVISPNCYGHDELNSINMVNDRSEANHAAVRYGFARVGISTPDGEWTFGNNGIVNDDVPMPCDDADSKDIPYIKALFSFIESNPDKFDASRVYAEGFSQNSMFAAYTAFCMNDKVLGVWQGGSGMGLTGLPPTLPGSQAQCTADAFKQYGPSCATKDPCTECQYWPIYPCYQPSRPMIDCVVEYDNDPVSTSDDPDQTTGKYMYNALVNEGHAARFLQFSPSNDGTIKGGHSNPQNAAYWQVGCWGLTDACSSECEQEFINCVNSRDVSTAMARAISFKQCIDDRTFTGLKGCQLSCSPTLEMMKSSEKPTTIWNGEDFGATLDASPQPASSKCSADNLDRISESTASASKPTVPTECNSVNQGRCECGDTSKGFTTYTFWLDDEQRCFTFFRPVSNDPLPVVISPNCYGFDALNSINMVNDRSEANHAAVRYGFARVGISTPDGNWEFGNNGIINDDKPMPCDDADSKDIPYIKALFSFIKSNPDKFDASRVYAEGFSQNSMFSAYTAFCMSENVAGIWQGGSGLSLTGLPPTLPQAEAQCSHSSYEKYGASCATRDPCTECQYFPIYPCYQPSRPMIDCVVEYDNDPISTSDDPDQTTGKYMYNALVNEGQSARFLQFSPSNDGTIQGGHSNPQNAAYWQVGCWGLTEACSSECEREFITCVNSGDVSTAMARVFSFKHCIDDRTFTGLKGCQLSCSPTLEMMKSSETPTTIWNGEDFGANLEASPQPTSSKCSVDEL